MTKDTDSRQDCQQNITKNTYIYIYEGVNGVNRPATKGEKILLTTDKRRKKIPNSDKKLTQIYRQPTKVENPNRQLTK